jgi:nucleotidyltransferase substrate binding protein (TIGR01987 family)
MDEKDIRWKQRFSNYQKATSQLNKFIQKGELNELEKQGLIQAFEYTFELAWNVMKDFLNDRGNQSIYGSRDAITEAFQNQLIQEGEEWMGMIKSRIASSHTYNEEVAEEIVNKIKNKYFFLFETFLNKMQSLL